VHFAHAGRARTLRRSRRNTLPYKLNAALAAPLSRLAETLLYRPRRTGTLVAVSRGLARELRTTAPVVVISNGVDTELFRPNGALRASGRAELGVGDDELVALFVGNEWEAKGLRLAIDAVARTPEWRLVVVGEGDRAAYAGAPRVHFLGERRDVERWYAAADALVAPSAYETFSFVVHEAAATALPIVATRVHGVEDLLEGSLVPRDPVAIAAALQELTDPVARRRAGERARAAATRLTWDDAVDAYVRLYEVAA
jgi:UDP-glucose:(heptosyl)LPS alpha-1,3-glucosyltransferase